MISIEWNKDNLKNFERKIETLIKQLPETTKIGVEDSLKNTQEKALQNKRGSKDKKLIPIEILDFNKGEVVGRVYTDKNLFSHAVFMEYGTGTKAELPHIGKTKTFIASGYQYWYLPVEKVDKQFSPERIITINGRQFYLMFATKPYPFMRPASFSSRQENADLLNERIGKLLMEVLK
ncbi:MAG: hypothetical protein HFI86_05870 [Bacilli bacterium]|nr:hypothetical protein [Bacilli bacterium]